MRDFNGKVAVITGGASGIGFALARKAASEGMKIVIADVEEGPLSEAETKLKAAGAEALAVRTDVSKFEEVEALADKAFDAFGGVHLLCNNAGVNLPISRPAWEVTVDDWRWITGVNLWGVIHGVRAFVPRMLEQDAEGHVVNTSSSVGMASTSGLAGYKLTKHAVLSLTETLAHDFSLRGAKLNASALCPSTVSTGLRDSARNRPAQLKEGRTLSAEEQKVEDALRGMSRNNPAATAGEVAERVFDGIREGKLYIFTDDSPKDYARKRLEEIIAEVSPKATAVLEGRR